MIIIKVTAVEYTTAKSMLHAKVDGSHVYMLSAVIRLFNTILSVNKKALV